MEWEEERIVKNSDNSYVALWAWHMIKADCLVGSLETLDKLLSRLLLIGRDASLCLCTLFGDSSLAPGSLDHLQFSPLESFRPAWGHCWTEPKVTPLLALAGGPPLLCWNCWFFALVMHFHFSDQHGFSFLCSLDFPGWESIEPQPQGSLA